MEAAIGMPDLHPGNRHPIGGAFISRGRIYPPLGGGDIGCGMMLLRTNLRFDSDADKLAHRLRGIEGSLG